jgi:hypothetical protein
MRRIAAVAVVLAVALASRGRSDDAAAPSTTVPPAGATPPATTEPTPTNPAAIEHETTVEGTVPDLEGRWLLLATLAVGQSTPRLMVSGIDVTRKDGKLDVRERHLVLPPEQNAALTQGNETGKIWDPTPADLDAIRKAWDTMQVENRGITGMTHELTGRDAFDDVLKGDAITKDALWVVRQGYVFEPGGGRPMRQGNLWAVTKEENGVYSGSYVAVALAAAPFPIPIRFDGTFKLVPLGPPERSLWSRVADVFAGCNRR